jgi:hypothetical protein
VTVLYRQSVGDFKWFKEKAGDSMLCGPSKELGRVNPTHPSPMKTILFYSHLINKNTKTQPHEESDFLDKKQCEGSGLVLYFPGGRDPVGGTCADQVQSIQ